jgi:hypothetical protein
MKTMAGRMEFPECAELMAYAAYIGKSWRGREDSGHLASIVTAPFSPLM